MADEFFNLDEELVEFAEMSGFDFVSGKYVNADIKEEPVISKYGTFDVLDLIKNIFQKESSLLNQK